MLELVLGPLIAPECRRALSRRWLLVARALAAVPAGLVVLAVAWLWWFLQQMLPNFLPGEVLRGGLITLQAMLVLAAVVLGPALLAGTLAGDRARGMLTLLLGCQVSTLEIVVARLAGRLASVGVLLLAALPAAAFLAGACSLGPGTFAAMVALPGAIAFGGGGLALAASATAQRGRDALLAVYLVELLLLSAPLLGVGLPAWCSDWLGIGNPFRPIAPLVSVEHAGPALATSAFWALLGLAGTCWAAWRLRPGYLREAEGKPAAVRGRRRLPAIGERPLLWKELHVGQGTSFHWFVRWLGALLVAGWLGTVVVLSGLVVQGEWLGGDRSWAQWAVRELSWWAGSSSWPLSWLVQWSVALRAAVGVSSERDWGTWDVLLTTPAPGREIGSAKILGSVWGLRWLLAAVLAGWTLSALCGALDPTDYLSLVLHTLAMAGLMAAIGIWCSLVCSTATGAMTLALGGWLAAMFCVMVAAFILTAIFSLVVMLAWLAWLSWTDAWQTAGTAGPPLIGSFGTIYTFIQVLLYLVAMVGIAGYVAARFDQLAGRARGSPLGVPRPVPRPTTPRPARAEAPLAS